MNADEKQMDKYCNMPQAEFYAEMMAQYGNDAFKQGLDILKKNKLLVIEDGGPAKLDDMLRSIIADETARKSFLKICGQYIFITGFKI